MNMTFITFMALPLMKYTFFVSLDEINEIFIRKDLNILYVFKPL